MTALKKSNAISRFDSSQVVLQQPESGFVTLAQAVPSIVQDMRYGTPNNFTGQVVPGYEAPVAYVTVELAQALQQAQRKFLKQGLTLVVYDAYRPLQASRFFRAWAQEPETGATQKAYYPHLTRQQLFNDEWVVEYSSHCRGAAIDVTLAPVAFVSSEASSNVSVAQVNKLQPSSGRETRETLDMGTDFDYFDERSFTDHQALSKEVQANRQLLKSVMTACGLINLPTEWWHYMLAEEPYPTTYFDWPIRPTVNDHSLSQNAG